MSRLAALGLALALAGCGTSRSSWHSMAKLDLLTSPVVSCPLSQTVCVRARLEVAGAPVEGATLFVYFPGSRGPGDKWVVTDLQGEATCAVAPLALGPQLVEVEVWDGPPAVPVALEIEGTK